MKYVPIVPQGSEKLLLGSERVFCFANLAYSNSRYRNWFRRTTQEVLMDHPVYELRPALGLQQTLDVMRAVRPHMTTIPDVHEDYDTTMDMFWTYAPVMRQAFPDIKLMGVPQGLSVDEILVCAYAMANSGLCDMLAIGIKRSMPNLDRDHIVQVLHKEYPRMRFHLLGAHWPYTNERLMAEYDWVESLDSAEPINAALAGHRMSELSNYLVGKKATARPQYFDSLGRFALNASNLIEENIRWMSQLLSATPKVSQVEAVKQE